VEQHLDRQDLESSGPSCSFPSLAQQIGQGLGTDLEVGFGCKNGGFYIVRVSDGMILAHTPLYNGPPTDPLNPPPDKRTLALPGPIGGIAVGVSDLRAPSRYGADG
jgi:hypothetical protein